MDQNHRRTFLKTLGLGTGAFMLGSIAAPRLARAANTGRSFVFCYFRGGWDTLLGLDPRDPNVFTDARKGETKIELGYDRLGAAYPQTIQQPAGSNIQFGPALGGIMHHYDKMCVVRGMTMDTVSHEVGRLYFITGKPPRGSAPAGSSLGTRIVAQQGDQTALPNLVSRVDSYNENLPTYASGLTVSSVADLVSTLTDGRSAPTATIRAKIEAHRAKKLMCDPSGLDRRGLVGLIQSSQSKARELVEGGLSAKFQFLSQNDPEMMDLAARYDIQAALTTAQAQAAMAYQALKYGMAQAVTIELAGGCDTHDTTWATDQPDEQSIGFTALATLVSDLASTEDSVRGGKLLDHTTILAFSEFGRTAMLNSREGRDHSLTASCMLIGAGVPHNKVVGASSDVGMVPRAVDPVSGRAVDAGGTFLTPTLVAASIMESAGYDTDDLRTNGLPCLMA
jgi:uncharacterized protein (DUF1501 family)